MRKQPDERPALSTRVLNTHVMPGMVPYELIPYLHPLLSCAVDQISKSKGSYSATVLTPNLVKVLQTYYAGRRRRSGPSSAGALRLELEPIEQTLQLLIARLGALSKEANEELPRIANLLKEAELVLPRIGSIVAAASKRGRPSDQHIADTVRILSNIWEHSFSRKMGKTLDKNAEKTEYVAPGPFFIQKMFFVLDPSVQLRALDTAIMKLPAT